MVVSFPKGINVDLTKPEEKRRLDKSRKPKSPPILGQPLIKKTKEEGTMNLILAAIIGIAAIILLIVWLKVHPFLALLLGSAIMAVCSGMDYTKMLDSFTSGLGETVGGVGILIALGGVIGMMLIKSGGADVIVDSIISRTKENLLPWAMAGVAFIIGIPLFFEVGVVILIPVVMMIANRTKKPVVLLGIPALAGLSALHAFVPPHPGPLAAIANLHSNLGVTLGLGILVAIPTVIISGPLLAKVMVKWVPVEAKSELIQADEDVKNLEKKPTFGTAIFVILLPVILMLASSIDELAGWNTTPVGKFIAFLGTPLVALVITAIVGIFLLGIMQGRTASDMNSLFGKGFESIAGILLIVGAGGGFKQTLVDSGIDKVITDGITANNINPIFAAWLIAVLIRLATGSATVATVTASGLVAPLAVGMSPTHLALLVLAVGAGSVFLSHVNDAGFWLVKEYFGLTVKQTFLTWSLMETVLSCVGFVCVFLLSLVL